VIDAEAKPAIAARRHHESLDLVCGARPNYAVRRRMHRAHPCPPIPERSASSFLARTGLPAVDTASTARSKMCLSFRRRSRQTSLALSSRNCKPLKRLGRPTVRPMTSLRMISIAHPTLRRSGRNSLFPAHLRRGASSAGKRGVKINHGGPEGFVPSHSGD